MEETITQTDKEDVEGGRGDRLVFVVNDLYVCVGYLGRLPGWLCSRPSQRPLERCVEVSSGFHNWTGGRAPHW